jgi:signal transduction histidine kinase
VTVLTHAGPSVSRAPAPGVGVRHDLRHELATLQVLVVSAQQDPAADLASLRALLATASTEIRYALDLLDGLPADPAPASTVAPVSGQVSDLDAVLRSAARVAAGGSRSVTVASEPDLLVPLASVSLARVVRNLLGNALATPGGSAVLLRGSRAGQGPAGSGDPSPHVRLEVHDDGRGRARGGFRRSGGMGLEVVRSIVVPAGGWLVLGPSSLGGVCAAVTLPAAPR